MPENEEAVILDELERMRLMAKAVANSAHPFLIGFKDGRILLVNHAFCQLTGFTEEELLNMTWNHDLTPSEWHEVQENTIEEVYRTKKALHYEKEYLRKDGTRIPVEVFIHPYLNDIGQITYYYGFVTDLTSRNQAVEELRKSETHLRELTENMRDIYMKVDNRGFIEYTNPAFKTVLGYEPRDTLGTFFIDVIHPDDEVRVRKEFTEYMKNRQPARIDYRCRHADGHYLYVETVGSWLIDNDEITSIILITRDITNRKLAETALRQSEEKFSKIFKFSPDTIAISILEDGRYVDVNDAFTQLTGYERYEAIGHTAFELGIWVDTADRDYFTNLLKNHAVSAGWNSDSGLNPERLSRPLFPGK
ncbi:PAS domain-containing protein [Syntrophomonas palmitatica]|uniref:PAS domain-containing protein n=1 Tax=Syntrophomonas palmitatica TaxID=402877 RepID=UPI0006D1C90F|nr:PAS domain S-box protein [Syntrophomonas palmitatica]